MRWEQSHLLDVLLGKIAMGPNRDIAPPQSVPKDWIKQVWREEFERSIAANFAAPIIKGPAWCDSGQEPFVAVLDTAAKRQEAECAARFATAQSLLDEWERDDKVQQIRRS